MRFAAKSLCASLAIAAAAAAQQRSPLQQLRAMEVRGTSAYAREQIAMALVGDPEVSAVLRRADAAAATTVAELVAEMHRDDGYLGATAAGSFENGVLVLDVAAGDRSVYGAIRVAADADLPLLRIRELLATRGNQAERWLEGAAPRFGPAAIARIQGAIAEACAESGRHGVRTEIELVPNGGAVDASIRVLAPGRVVRIRDVKIEGATAPWAEPAAALLEVEPSVVATGARLLAIRKALEATAWFQSVVVELPEDPPAELAPLVVRVKPWPGAPAPDKLPVSVVSKFAAAIEKLQQQIASGRAICIEGVLAEDTEVAASLRLGAGPLRLVLANDLALLEVGALHLGGGAAQPLSVRVGGGEATLRLGQRLARWNYREGAGVRFGLATRPTDHGGLEVRWYFGLEPVAADAPLMVVQAHPATAGYLLSRPSLGHRQDGDALVLNVEDRELCRIDASGLQGDTVQLPLPGFTGAVRLPDLADVAPLSTAVVGEAVASPFAVVSELLAPALETSAPELAAVLAGLDRAFAIVVRAPKGEAPPRPPPRYAATGDLGKITALLFGSVAVDPTWRGWPVELAEILTHALGGDGRSAAAGIDALVANPANGPVALAAAAWVMDRLGKANAAIRLRQVARQRFGLDAVLADLSPLADKCATWLPAAAAVGAGWRAEPALQELFAGLPEGRVGDERAWRLGLEFVWQHGGEASLRQLLLDE